MTMTMTVNRSRSHTPILPPYYSITLEFFEENLRRDREAYEILIDNNGRPMLPDRIELRFEVFNNPGQYEEPFL